jgi:hypothetical protein
MPKRKCVFTANLKAEYTFINKDQHAGKVFCTICKSLFSIRAGAKAQAVHAGVWAAHFMINPYINMTVRLRDNFIN